MAPNRQHLESIRVVGACENNLRNLTLTLPRGELVALAGASGAGKSTLAHHVLARVARRRLGRLRGEPGALASAYEPKVEAIEGLPPCIEIKQEPLRGQSRSTVATYTGILHLLAGLFLHHGESRSPSGAEVLPIRKTDLAEWLFRHYKGSEVQRAEIRPDLVIASVKQFPQGDFYFRERHSEWALGTRSAFKTPSTERWWIAVPKNQVTISSVEEIRRLIQSETSNSLWVVKKSIFLEDGEHRIAADDPVPYERFGRSLFSFNISRPGGGQCPVCKGLGITQGVKEATLLRSMDAPLLDGGLNLPKTGGRFTHLGVLDEIIRGLCFKEGIPSKVTWRKLPAELKRKVMYGTGNELVPELRDGESRLRTAKRPFAGIVPLVLDRARSTGPAAKIFQPCVEEMPCQECGGSRYNRSARASKWRGHSVADLVLRLSLSELRDLLGAFAKTPERGEKDWLQTCETLLAVYQQLKLGHLSLSRATTTLSGGEAQRLKLGLGLALQMKDVCYIVDEPSRGLHSQDVEGLAQMLRATVDEGNSVIIVEHHPKLLSAADHLVTLGPGGGTSGGCIIYEGTPENSPLDTSRVEFDLPLETSKSFVEVSNVQLHNLSNIGFRIPTAKLTGVVGVSGAGKSSAILGALVPAACRTLEGAGESPICRLRLPKEIRFVEVVGQKLAAQNRRSVVGSVVDILDPLRAHFASQPAARALSLKAADFSFNSTGACPACGGSGFAQDGFGKETADRCHACSGSRLAGPALLVRSEGCGFAELLEWPVSKLFTLNHPALEGEVKTTLGALVDLGLGHLALGRATPTLSAGERQRLALSRFLARIERGNGIGLLVLDEPTAGLSTIDARRVFAQIRTLATKHGHTVIALEHKLELLPSADWIIEFGPGGGPDGGQVIYEGTLDGLRNASTPTAEALSSVSSKSPVRQTLQKGSTGVSEAQFSWEACAEVFEPLAARLETHDEADLVRPVHPAVRLDPKRFPDDVRVGELLELLPWARRHGKDQPPKNIETFTDQQQFEGAIKGQAFGFSPVAPQLRLGLATQGDLEVAIRSLAKMGFNRGRLGDQSLPLSELPKRVLTNNDLLSCAVVCSLDAPETLRTTGIRWSEGVVKVYDDSQERKLSTQFIGEGGIIGFRLTAPFIGDCRSAQGRCPQCLGSGRLPSYPWNLIVADERRGIAEDGFWNPAVLVAIRALRRSRLIPEAKFFANQRVADFRNPPAKMDRQTRLYFEHGLPWRRFEKPNAIRTDREQDYYSWRGLHDYVYQSLGRMVDANHKRRLRAGVSQVTCPCCEGTGMGWEAAKFQVLGRSLVEIWKSMSLLDWKERLACQEPSLNVALELGLGRLRANDRFDAISEPDRSRLLLALVPTAILQNLTLISDGSIIQPSHRTLLKRMGMQLVASTLKANPGTGDPPSSEPASDNFRELAAD